ncbi:MAG: hypothetical protein COU81_01020 [Candidatus Portnoybacteria bacterium CG10_big_fil_rev_8_21_14_0_10_36_7]|uniref:Uncharacterized protein n=1 Tax=Candidatus Portnoybacteria bacterium CG10_big_fil_rev_8_21_14_0_10_36_7 TaxID=1974812 RepID=A0A2M8KEP7_9BACT|nr:MAG: hypothetical protein COU81_01020 [Candidatus Portnoybacteria bacterium CG10_big_fil_rev_8_21_14_0_10_36_7]
MWRIGIFIIIESVIAKWQYRWSLLPQYVYLKFDARTKNMSIYSGLFKPLLSGHPSEAMIQYVGVCYGETVWEKVTSFSLRKPEDMLLTKNHHNQLSMHMGSCPKCLSKLVKSLGATSIYASCETEITLQ